MNGAQQQARLTAASIEAVSCHICNLLVSDSYRRRHGNICPRCGTALHRRKPDSMSRTWALLIAAAILYVPANVYPILTVVSFGQPTTSTIIGGVIELAAGGQWVIAAVVFIASVFVPIFKILALLFLALSVQLKWQARPRARTLLYRFTEFIGRWSMIDIFMISILIALVKLQALATVTAGPGAIAFAAVVIITMFAAMTFDPRLIWDTEGMGDDGG
ncbi:MAG: paraquat-inducible membrane protein A [Sneathiella sp.]|jgi:paraquat-inducible protein A|uniref:paraquat-inducible protein A n=1 Tax=Sneathiella sp. TaxID=1964365 RepID=UPI000C380D76|nr:paraquat-inducible protein A [Sneathiella sp.]MAL78332.1 paraquat-inducible membrane protein A [Sneathiella sp.]